MINTEYKFGTVYGLADLVQVNDDQVQFKNIFSNENGGVALIAFREGQRLDTHTAPADVMVTVLEGEIEFTMLEKTHVIRAGEFLLMGADVPHSVASNVDSKVMLTKIK